jgi:electron transfer flavoprotein alpha subunit
MSVLVYVDSIGGSIAKNGFEAVYYASKLGNVVAVTAGNASDEALAELGKYGASKVLKDSSIKTNDPQQLTRLIAKAVETTGATTVVVSHDLTGKAVAPRLSARLKAGLVAGAIALPEGDKIKVNVFSGKAFGFVKVNTSSRIISVLPNSMKPEATGAACTVESFSGDAGAAGLTVKATKKPEGAIPLPEAELVVSAGRGLKGPENWGMVEELATALGAATACSRPVADIGWRPHHEHVGQTGVAIRPNLYIAAGISGAIQHLAGVNGSKTIVVINTDPEAPFFKAADYGIVGDAFEVLPKLTEAVKKFKAAN